MNCHIATQLAPDNAPVVPVRDLEMIWGSMAENFVGASLTSGSQQHWLSFMHPEALQRLNLSPLSAHLHRMLFDIASTGALYTSLRSLKLPWFAVESSFFFDVLGRSVGFWWVLVC